MVRLLISDTNIFIDLIEGNILHLLFRLSYQVGVPDILYFEELAGQHSNLIDLGLTTLTLESESMVYAHTLTRNYQRASRNDCFALALAKQENAPLITGDKELRKAAEKEQVKCKGTIWVVEKMLIQQLISVDDACSAFKRMKKQQRRLPWEQVEKMLSKNKRT